MKVVLSNSVGVDDWGYYIIHSPSRWTEGVKLLSSWFAYYPWELAYTSSLLKQKTSHKVKLLDPCLKRWDKYHTLNKILQEEPDWLIIESSTRVIEENLWVAREVKKRLKFTKVVFVGAHASAYPERLLKQGADYVCIGEYEYTIVELVEGKDPNEILGLYPNPRRPLLDFARLPWPEDEDVKRIDYGIPGEPSSEYVEIQAYASRGCWGNCNFCVARHLYYCKPNWRRREVEDIIDEIKYLKSKYPQMQGIFFDEETHNGNKAFIKELTNAIRRGGLDKLKFEAMCDARLLDEEMLEMFKSAGYYKIRFGIETASAEVACEINKPIKLERLIQILRFAKRIGLKMYGTFMFGAKGSTFERDLKTIKFMEYLIREGLLSNVQISIATPLPGTPFYNWAKEKGYIKCEDPHLFDGGNFVLTDYPWYSKEEIEKIKDLAFAERDHLYLKRKVKADPINFLSDRIKRYGFRLTLEKIFRRLKMEFTYLRFKYLSAIILALFLASVKSSKAECINLPPPSYKGNLSVEEAIYKRRSIRSYRKGPLTLRELSQLCWAAVGKTIDGVTGPTRAYPSAGAIYEINLYIFVSEVENLTTGFYKYDWRGHTLLPMKRGNFKDELTKAALGQRMLKEAPVVFIFTGNPRIITRYYGRRGIQYMYIDLGHAAQNLYLEAEALGLGTVAIGAFDENRVKELLGLSEELPLYLMPVGRR